MLNSIVVNKNKLSFLGVFAFAFLLLATSFYTELFHKRSTNLSFPELFKNTLSDTDFTQVEQIHVHNRLGSYILKKDKNNWYVDSPKQLLAKGHEVKNLFTQLRTFEVQKIFEKDDVNLRSFSLDRPVFSLTLFFPQQEIKLDVGLTNSLNNSSFISLSNAQYIYQTTELNTQMDAMGIGDIIEARIAPFQQKEIQQISLYKQSSNSAYIDLKFENNQWLDSHASAVNPEKVKLYLDQLSNFKSQIILDQITPEATELVSEKLEKPYYTIVIRQADGRTHKVEISSLVNKIPGTKINKWQTVLVRSDFHKNIMIVDKDLLKLFNTSERRFKGVKLDNLFY